MHRPCRFTIPSHHQTYIDKLNAALQDHPKLADIDPATLLMHLDEVPEANPGGRQKPWRRSCESFVLLAALGKKTSPWPEKFPRP
jgi:superoxide dismutase